MDLPKNYDQWRLASPWDKEKKPKFDLSNYKKVECNMCDIENVQLYWNDDHEPLCEECLKEWEES